MASKIIAPFVGPLTPAAIDEWLSQCEDGFAIYASTKSDKSPELDAVTQIRLTGTQLHEPSTAAWWNAGRKEFLKLASWDLFEKKIRARFMAKGYKLIALRMFFLCSQGKTPSSSMQPLSPKLAMLRAPQLSPPPSTSTSSSSTPTLSSSFESWPCPISTSTPSLLMT
jgi:hypothetical protein